jgi:membrane-associated phospholipid phosphatase
MILLNYLYKIDIYYLILFLFLIAWARIYLKKHTSKEIIAAAIITVVGTIASIILFY